MHPLLISLLIAFAVVQSPAGWSVVEAQNGEWDATTYPNPTADGYQACNMRSTSSVCDPDAVLSEQQRHRLNYELQQLESRTRQQGGSNFCEKKGIVAAIAIAKHVRGASENAVKAMANNMLQRWTLDDQCQKSMVIVMATEDRKFWVARDAKVPVYGAEFTELFNEQKPLFQRHDYPQALLNIVQGTWDRAIAKQTPTGGQGGGRQQPFTPAQPGGDDWGRGRARGGPPSKGFSIPFWFWVLLVMVIIPTLCCCCCLYYCCCRKKNGGERRQGASDGVHDPEIGAGGRVGGGGGRRGGGGGIQSFLGGMGGAAIGNHLSNWMTKRGRRNEAPPPYPGSSGDYQPGQSQPGGQGGGAALYPSVAVKDEGGGGGW